MDWIKLIIKQKKCLHKMLHRLGALVIDPILGFDFISSVEAPAKESSQS